MGAYTHGLRSALCWFGHLARVAGGRTANPVRRCCCDVAKPSCTRQQDGRITSRGHSRRGTIDAAFCILWDLDADFAVREQICALVRHHQAPFHLINRPDAQRLALRISQTARCDLLTMLAKADAFGRRGITDQARVLENVSRCLRNSAASRAVCSRRGQFPSAHNRFLYFRLEDRDPNYLAFDDSRCTVTLMSGLPGSGKNTWIAGLPDLRHYRWTRFAKTSATIAGQLFPGHSCKHARTGARVSAGVARLRLECDQPQPRCAAATHRFICRLWRTRANCLRGV